MEARAKILGHPIHQMLIVFPLGLLSTSFFFDVAFVIWKKSELATVSFWMIAAGIAGGLLAAIFGFIDWLAIPAGTRAKDVGMWHGAANVAVTGIFFASWFLRRSDAANPPLASIALSGIAVSIALVAGWLGGELVDRLGVGVSEGAHLDSPSSLSGRPATERNTHTS
jgi:uncharacterized membrane protein